MSESPSGSKENYRIGEVSDLTEIKPHVLRYWETEFPFLRPKKSEANQRLYSQRDVELIFYLKKLLYEEGYTISGARAKLESVSHEAFERMKIEAKEIEAGAPDPGDLKALWYFLRQELQEVHDLLATIEAPKNRLPPSGHA